MLSEFKELKAGRLSPKYFDTMIAFVWIEITKAYGKKSQLSELAQIVSKNATTVQIHLYDEGLVNEVNKVLSSLFTFRDFNHLILILISLSTEEKSNVQ